MNYAEHTSTGLMITLIAAGTTFAVAESVRHEGHLHGIAELTLALEGEHLELAITSPAMSIVGFEHKASTPEQVHAIADADSTLRNVEQMFTFTGTQCSSTSILIDMSAVIGTENHDTNEKHHDHEESHSDISAQYKYDCSNTADLESVSFGADRLPFSLEKVNVRWVSDRGQGATVLTADNQEIEFN